MSVSVQVVLIDGPENYYEAAIGLSDHLVRLMNRFSGSLCHTLKGKAVNIIFALAIVGLNGCASATYFWTFIAHCPTSFESITLIHAVPRIPSTQFPQRSRSAPDYRDRNYES